MMKNPKLKILFGFPVIDDQSPSPDKKKRGVSLLIALMTIALMVSFVSDMIITSAVNVEMAITTRDRVKAEYLAKSGLNLAIFIITLGWGVDLFQAQASTPAAFRKDLSDTDSSLWAIFNDLPPIGASTVDFLNAAKGGEKGNEDPFHLQGIMNEKVSQQMRLFEDQFTIHVEDEGSKINLNTCAYGKCLETIQQLINLFSCPAEKEFLRSKNIDPQELAYRIKDFISVSGTTSQESGYSDKNTPYLKTTPSYKAKGMQLDTLDELKLIDGWDDDLHTIFAPYLTVYPFNLTGKPDKSRININTAKKELLSCMVKEARSNACAEQFNLKLKKIKTNKGAVALAGVSQTLKDLMCYTGDGTDENGEKAQSTPDTWFDTKSSVLRITVSADTGMQTIILEAVIRKIMPKETEHGRAKQQLKRSYEILFFKVS